METNTSLFPTVRDDITFDTLNDTALASLSTLCTQSWSHTALSDPGIALLEAITYGISDLSYRHSLPLNDLLTLDGDVQQSLFPETFSPEKALTCDPVTVDDYRRALLDLHSTDDDTGHFYFRDVQFIQEPEDERYQYFYHRDSREFNFKKPNEAQNVVSLKLKGNYWLYLALQDVNDKAVALDKVNAYLESHRNLGESVSRIHWLSASPVKLSATIELEDSIEEPGDVEQVLANIYQAANLWCTPPVARYTTQQLLDQGTSPESIMEGPRLQHGWIPRLPDEVDYGTPRNVVLNLLVNPLLNIPGVKRIRKLSCNQAIPENNYACLWDGDVPEAAVKNITLISKGGIHKVVTADQLRNKIRSVPLLQVSSTLLQPGRHRKPGASHPVSELLPPCYGLQSKVVGPEQKQLHQFMLPFEQLLNNGCQQLAKLPHQLSFERETGSNVWAQKWPLLPSSPAGEVHQDYEVKLRNFLENSQSDVNKELDTVNYLLSYFDRSIAAPGLDGAENYLASQQYYLSNYATLAAQRSTIRIEEMSSLQKRLTARLGLHFEQLSGENVRFDSAPFYLIEHRKLLPEKPDSQFDNEQKVASAKVVTREGRKYLNVCLSVGHVDNIRVGQLVDLLLPASSGTVKQRLRCLLVASVDIHENVFSLETGTHPQLQNNLQRVMDAASAGTLNWVNSETWLQDMNYQLSPHADQGELAHGQKRLTISPYPIMINKDDELTAQPEITQEGIVEDDVRKMLTFTVKEVDPIHNSVTLEIQGGDGWPDNKALPFYSWHFGNNSYVDKDRFSFVISLVFRQDLVSNTDNPYALEAWIKNIIREEVPAHISVVIHWMTENEFSSLASNYHSWQQAGTEVGLYSFGLLKKLALGHIPSSLNGIGAVFIADNAQRADVVGAKGDEWHPDIIEQDELFYVPDEVAESQ